MRSITLVVAVGLACGGCGPRGHIDPNAVTAVGLGYLNAVDPYSVPSEPDLYRERRQRALDWLSSQPVEGLHTYTIAPHQGIAPLIPGTLNMSCRTIGFATTCD